MNFSYLELINIFYFHGLQLKMVCVQGHPHMALVLLPVAQMKTAMGHRNVVVMAVVPGVWNQVRINETLVSVHSSLVIILQGFFLGKSTLILSPSTHARCIN